MGDGVTTGAEGVAGNEGDEDVGVEDDGFSDGFAGADDFLACSVTEGLKEGSFEFTDGFGVTDGVGATDGDGLAGATASIPPGNVAIRPRCLPSRGSGPDFVDGVAAAEAEPSPIASVRLAETLPDVASSGGLLREPSTAPPTGRALKSGDFVGVDRSDPIISYHPPKHRMTPPRPFTGRQRQWSALLHWRSFSACAPPVAPVGFVLDVTPQQSGDCRHEGYCAGDQTRAFVTGYRPRSR